MDTKYFQKLSGTIKIGHLMVRLALMNSASFVIVSRIRPSHVPHGVMVCAPYCESNANSLVKGWVPFMSKFFFS